MGTVKRYIKTAVALLIVGSATLLLSCSGRKNQDNARRESMLTQQSDSLTIIQSNNGVRKMLLKTPLLERYELAKDPYTEYRRGVDVVTYKDSTGTVESTIVADYAIYYEKRKLWEARGNVVASGGDERTLYTEQLFWDEKTGRVYSNVESKMVQSGDVFIGEGFESDDKFEKWEFRNYVGMLTVDASPTERADSVPEQTGDSGASGESHFIQMHEMQPPGTTIIAPATGTNAPAVKKQPNTVIRSDNSRSEIRFQNIEE